MLPSRPSRIFRSRWAALFWAAGVLWTTVELVGFGDSHAKSGAEDNGTVVTDATGSDVSNADLQVLRNFIDAGSK